MTIETTERPVRVGLISLGCAKNLVDAEVMVGCLLKDGVQITSDTTKADAVIVHTCSFIDAAQKESVDTVLESAAVREARNRGQALIVSGCLPQRYREELPGLLPEVDAFMGIDQTTQVADIVREALAHRAERLRRGWSDAVFPLTPAFSLGGREKRLRKGTTSVAARAAVPMVNVSPRPKFIPDFSTPRYRLTPRHFAYVKVADGCNHPCSFCIIPRIRGGHRSRPQADIVQEARELIAQGVKELNLISQDTTWYGLDLRPTRSGGRGAPPRLGTAGGVPPGQTTTLCTLLRALNNLRGDFWIRLLYTHPAHWTDQLIETVAACRKVARYVDIPLQHIDELMLERMRRETSRLYLEDLIRRIRAQIPDITLRTTFIVGFPGETEACFQALLDFIRNAKFERLGVFTYSPQAGTRAAKMANQVPDRVKKKRLDLAMAAQHEVARQVSASCVGRTLKVLVEGKVSARALPSANLFSWEHGLLREAGMRTSQRFTGHYRVARGEADAPDIDGRVYVRGNLPVGEFARVRVVGHADYDLIAEPV